MKAAKDASDLAEVLDQVLADRLPPVAALDRELAELLHVADRLEISAAQIKPSPEFRATARQRLVLAMAGSTSRPRASTVLARLRVRAWVMRFAAGLATLSVAGAAAATASASALPGEPLYAVKQATEAVTLHLATTDAARDEILLQHADTRLDEAGRLLDQGRAAETDATAARYDDTLGKLTVSTWSDADVSNLRTNEVRLVELLEAAPGSAGPGLERALAATHRSLARARPTTPATGAELTETVTTPPREARAHVLPADAPNPETVQPDGPPPTDRGERSSAEPLDTQAEVHDRSAERRPEVTPVWVDADVRAANGSGGESDAAKVPEGRATPPRANPQPPSSQSGRTAPQRPAAPLSQPGGRGRP